MVYLDSVSSSIPSSLPSHELERIAEATHHARDESEIPPLPVPQVGRERRPRHADHGVVEEPDVEGDADGEAGEGEVEEGRVHHHVWDASFQRVPLVVGGQVERRREEGVAHAGEGDDAEAQEGVRSQHLNVKFFVFFFRRSFVSWRRSKLMLLSWCFCCESVNFTTLPPFHIVKSFDFFQFFFKNENRNDYKIEISYFFLELL